MLFLPSGESSLTASSEEQDEKSKAKHKINGANPKIPILISLTLKLITKIRNPKPET